MSGQASVEAEIMCNVNICTATTYQYAACLSAVYFGRRNERKKRPEPGIRKAVRISSLKRAQLLRFKAIVFGKTHNLCSKCDKVAPASAVPDDSRVTTTVTRTTTTTTATTTTTTITGCVVCV